MKLADAPTASTWRQTMSRRADPGLVGLLVGQLRLRLALGLDPAQVVVDLVGEPGVVPAELGAHQRGGDRRGARRRGRRSRWRSGYAG